MQDGRLKRRGNRDQFVVRASTSSSRENRHGLRTIQYFGGGGERVVIGTIDRFQFLDSLHLPRGGTLAQEHFARNDDNSDTASLERRSHRNLEHLRKLFR